MELGENLKEHFSKITFYGLHAGNNQNSIWKPHSNFAFPEPYVAKFCWKKQMIIHILLKNVKTWGAWKFKKAFNTRKRLLLTALNTSVCWLSIHLLDGIFQFRENLAKNEKIEKFEKKI